MFPWMMIFSSSAFSLPRARGDVSAYADAARQSAQPSPRTRGCFFGEHEIGSGCNAFPAHAGMFLAQRIRASHRQGLPRARGDVSEIPILERGAHGPSPRTRGCFRFKRWVTSEVLAFPAHAGMFLSPTASGSMSWGLPRARGDVSSATIREALWDWPSPRTRGCFRGLCIGERPGRAFPAHAGMFLRLTRMTCVRKCLPRARGDVSEVRFTNCAND